MPPLTLVTGAAGRLGGVGRTVVDLLLERGLPVRALVRQGDERADALRDAGAEVVVVDLTRTDEVFHALDGVRRAYFGMSVSPPYLEATAAFAAAARERGTLEVLVNMSQMTVSQMSLTELTNSQQQRQHWLAEQVLNWSGLPVVHVRPTIFLQSFLLLAGTSIAQDDSIRLPFGAGKTSPVDAGDVAEVIATVLADPQPHIGKVYELTGTRSQDLNGLAAEFSAALGRTIRYVDIPLAPWRDVLRAQHLPEYAVDHIVTMAKLHAANRYDRLTRSIEEIIGRPATSPLEFAARNARLLSRSIVGDGQIGDSHSLQGALP
jgi:NAD(P)H dehydrogenase (quinone)